MANRPKCLILGGGGFIGSHVADALLDSGYPVRVFERESCDMHNLAHIYERIELVRGDFLDGDGLLQAMSAMEVVIHLVSTTVPKSSNEDMAHDISTNASGMIAVLDAARRAGVRKVIFTSSGGTVYGVPQFLPVAESHPELPICSHGIGKLAAEKYMKLYHHLYGLDYAILRCANPYGARQDPLSGLGAVAAFLWKTLKREPVTIWGDGSVARDFFHVGDLAAAVLAAIERETPSRIYNIGSGSSHTLNEVLDIVRHVTERQPEIRYCQSRPFDVPEIYLDISRAKRELAWHPLVSMEQGVALTWEYLLKSGGAP